MAAAAAAALCVLWLAHRRKHPADGHGAEDPLLWTDIEVFALVPFLLGSGSLLLSGSTVERALVGYLQSHPPAELFKHALLFQMFYYFAVGFFCLAIDLTHWPKWAWKLKLQPDTHIDYAKALPRLAVCLWFNVALPAWIDLVLPESAVQLKNDLLNKHLGLLVRTEGALPTVNEMILHTYVFLWTYDLLFFYAHWLLHQGSFYRHVHRVHHEWRSPTALAAAYAHPIEHVLSNLLPALVAAVLTRPHICTLSFFTLLGLTITLAEHSGYEFVETGAFHNLHHERYKDNYGLFGVTWDDFWGTRVRRVAADPATVDIKQAGPVVVVKKSE